MAWPPETEAFLDRLVGQSLLSLEPPSAHSLADSTIEYAGAMTELQVDPTRQPPLKALDVANFLASYLSARTALRWMPFEKVVQRVSERKKDRRAQDLDLNRARDLIGVFRRLRVFMFAANDRCLLHALVLLNFLSHYEMYPAWVIGVRTNPWGAHSWVQHGCFVFDGSPEQILKYEPILAA